MGPMELKPQNAPNLSAYHFYEEERVFSLPSKPVEDEVLLEGLRSSRESYTKSGSAVV